MTLESLLLRALLVAPFTRQPTMGEHLALIAIAKYAMCLEAAEIRAQGMLS